jgi:lysozyme
MLGIDVSHWQGTLDWGRIAAASEVRWCRTEPAQGHPWTETDKLAEHVRFALIKASGADDPKIPGSYADRTFAANWRGAKAAGIKRGAYHFMNGQKDGKAQAEFFLKTVKDIDPIAKGDLLPIVDVEHPVGPQEAPGRPFLRKELVAYVATVKAAMGNLPIIYTGNWYWPSIEGDLAEFGIHPLWLAAYSSKQPAPTRPWQSAALWQFSSRGKLDGLGANVEVDLNRSNVDLATLEIR